MAVRLYLGYTQNSIWDLSTESKAFRDTSYRPSLFWKWERARGAKAFFDGARVGFEHESNGGDADTSRSINIFFMRPQWRWQLHAAGPWSSCRSSTRTSKRRTTRISTTTAATPTGRCATNPA